MAQLEHSAILRIGGAISGSFRAAVGGISGATNRLQSNIMGLRDRQRGVTSSLREAEAAAKQMGLEGSRAVEALENKHRALESRLHAVAAEMARAEREAVRLGERGSKEVGRLRAESIRLEREQRQVAKEMRVARREAELLGIEGSSDVAKLRAAHESLGRVLDREQRKLERLQKLSNLKIGSRVGGALQQLGRNFASLAGTLARSATVIGGAGAAAFAWFTHSAIEATAGIERMRTGLVTLEGSEDGARRSMEWITKFADQTPYNIDQVGEAFTRLRTFSIDPTDGTLETLGDTAAAMGKDIMMAVEAMTDAVAGETERLKEFGIRSKTNGDQLTFFWKQNGEMMKKTVNKNNQDAIRSTLLAIWNPKYGGNMQKMSRTWDGLMSTLESRWQMFQVRVMESGGVFDKLKGRLETLLANIDTWEKDGTLDKWAKEIGAAYDWAFTKIGEAFTWVSDNWPEIKKTMGELWEGAKTAAPVLLELGRTVLKIGKWAVDAAGGPKNFAMGLAILGTAKVLAPLGSLLKVGWDVAAWLSESIGLSGKLTGALGGIGPALMRLGPGLAGLAAGLAPIAGWVAVIGGAAFAGYKAGEWLRESDEGTRLVESTGEFLGWDSLAEVGRADRRRIGEKLGLRTKELTPETFAQVRGVLTPAEAAKQGITLGWDPVAEAARERQKQGGIEQNIRAAGEQDASTTVNDHRVFNIQVDAAKADASEVAEKVSERLKRDMRREALASHG